MILLRPAHVQVKLHRFERTVIDACRYSSASLTNFETDDGLRRWPRQALPKRLSTTQRNVVKGWITKHGSDFEAVFRDRKINAMQHSVGVRRGPT
jgi:hypothetical protein